MACAGRPPWLIDEPGGGNNLSWNSSLAPCRLSLMLGPTSCLWMPWKAVYYPHLTLPTNREGEHVEVSGSFM